MNLPGSGLAKGLAVTMQRMTHRSVTNQYPDVKPELPPRSRGVIALVEENCTVCMLCARECPDWCIYIDSHKETIPAPEGGRERQRNVLDRFAIDFSLCMYCSICIEVCPFDALFWSPEFEYSEFDIRDLVHERERLTTWVATVPPPPAADVAAEAPKEVEAARKAAAKLASEPRATAPVEAAAGFALPTVSTPPAAAADEAPPPEAQGPTGAEPVAGPAAGDADGVRDPDASGDTPVEPGSAAAMREPSGAIATPPRRKPRPRARP